MEVKSYRDLSVWQKAMDIVVDCYRLTERFPKAEVYGLSSQLQRAAVSVPANIAEGHGRQHLAEYVQHLSIAYGSLMEVETHIQIAARLGYIDLQTSDSMIDRMSEIGRMLNGLMRSLRGKSGS
jgi:four helix bundle protein